MKKILKKSCFTLLSASLISATSLSTLVFAQANSVRAWKQEGGIWKYYDEKGEVKKGFIKLDKDWYYLNTSDGSMQTAWLHHTDGNWYFFNTLSDGTKGKMLTGWQWIDGYCYYFSDIKDATEGKMLANTKTPDGYFVNADGRWSKEDGSAYFVSGKGQITKANTSSALAKLRTASSGATNSATSKSGSVGSSSENSTISSEKNNQNSNDVLLKDENTFEQANKDKVKTKLIATEYTKLIDLGWIEYAVVSFLNGNIDDYNVLVNGVDVTDAITKVDDEGKIVKWASTISAPKNIEVLRKTDAERESFIYSNGRNELAPSVGDKDAAPAYILTNGAISIFDYHLDVYDEDGNVRRFPTTSTFDLSNKRIAKTSNNLPKASYAPAAQINENGNGQILIKLSLDENSKKWFDELSNVKILDYEYKTLNSDVSFIKEIDTTYGTTGVVKINLPQTNVRSNGKYFVNLGSDYSNDRYTVAVQLVRDTNYVLVQSTETPNPRLGNADVLFKIEATNGGSTFGNDLKMPVSGVELKFPSGKIVDLENIKEYSVIMDVLHIYEKYEDKNTKEEKVLLNEAGIYELTLHADGYKDISKKFEIGADTSVSASADIDVYSSATGTSIGSSTNADGSTSTSTYNINANLLFEHDLIANALILNQLGLRNQAATEVINRFFTQKPESILTKDLGTAYNLSDFLNKVKAQRLDSNTQLSFAEYINDNPKKNSYVGKIKRVLEDGKLGPVTELGDLIGEDILVSGLSAKEGIDFELSFSDDTYINNISKIYLDGSGTALRSDSYLEEYKIEDGKLIIKANALRSSFGIPYVGKHKLKIYARNYKLQELELTVLREDGNVSISIDNSDNLKLDEELRFELRINEHTAENVLASLKEVVIINQDNNTEKRVLPIGQEGRDIGYKVVDSALVIANKTIKEAGNYILVLKTNAYGQKQLNFKLLEADNSNNNEEEINTDDEAKTTPTFKNAIYVPKASGVFAMFSDAAKYVIEFEPINNNEQSILDYLDTNKNLSVKVNQKVYTKGILNLNDSQFKIGQQADSSQGGAYKYLHLAADGFDQDENIVSITVDGYKVLTFTLIKSSDGNVVENNENGTTNTGSDESEANNDATDGTSTDSNISDTSATENSNSDTEVEEEGMEVPVYAKTGVKNSRYTGSGLLIEYTSNDNTNPSAEVSEFLVKLIPQRLGLSTKKQASIIVDDVEYEYVDRYSYPYQSGNIYTIGINSNGRYTKILISNESSDENKLIKIKADGYKTFSLILDNQGNRVD